MSVGNNPLWTRQERDLAGAATLLYKAKTSLMWAKAMMPDAHEKRPAVSEVLRILREDVFEEYDRSGEQ